MRYRLQRHDGTDCSATMVPITVLRMVPIQRYRHRIVSCRNGFAFTLSKQQKNAARKSNVQFIIFIFTFLSRTLMLMAKRETL